jgi:hypothetical protein
MPIRIWAHLGQVFVGCREVASNYITESLGVQDIQVWVIVYAGSPFTAEEFPVGWVNFIFEGLFQGR